MEEKIRMQKESDLKIALETTFGGDTNNTPSTGLDGLSLPTTKEEFQDFTDSLSKKLLGLSKNTEYPVFTENLLRNLCATCKYQGRYFQHRLILFVCSVLIRY